MFYAFVPSPGTQAPSTAQSLFSSRLRRGVARHQTQRPFDAVQQVLLIQPADFRRIHPLEIGRPVLVPDVLVVAERSIKDPAGAVGWGLLFRAAFPACSPTAGRGPSARFGSANRACAGKTPGDLCSADSAGSGCDPESCCTQPDCPCRISCHPRSARVCLLK